MRSAASITNVFLLLFFFFCDTATTEIYALSLHDALPICFQPAPWPWWARAMPRPTASAWPKPDRKSTRLNSSHPSISYAVFRLKKKNHIFFEPGQRKQTLSQQPNHCEERNE